MADGGKEEAQYLLISGDDGDNGRASDGAPRTISNPVLVCAGALGHAWFLRGRKPQKGTC